MSTFEVLALCLFFVGGVVPIWAGLILHFSSNRNLAVDGKSNDEWQVAKSKSYIRVINTILDELKQEENRAPVIIACLRDLHLFPEYRDITILLLDEISVTGHSHFDQLMKKELARLETSLLERSHV